jgi:hypothetical protein
MVFVHSLAKSKNILYSSLLPLLPTPESERILAFLVGEWNWSPVQATPRLAQGLGMHVNKGAEITLGACMGNNSYTVILGCDLASGITRAKFRVGCATLNVRRGFRPVPQNMRDQGGGGE